MSRGSRHHRKGRRIRRFFRKNKKLVIAVTVVILACAAALTALGVNVKRKQDSLHVTAGNSVDMQTGYRDITYEGKHYRYNSLIKTVLYAGIDSVGEITENAGYADAARADSIAVAVLNQKTKRMTVIALDRDTMTEVRRYSMSGRNRGDYVTHLGFAYAYGEGGEVSCYNLKDAVSNLLGGIPINEYVITNQTSMTYINDLVGGVTVQVPNNDLVSVYPEYKKGATVTVDEDHVSDFLQYRDTTLDFSNEGRVQRQQVYITAYVDQLKELIRNDPETVWDKQEQMKKYLQTSVTKNKYLNLCNLLEMMEFTNADYYRPDGTYVAGKAHDEFYVDEEALRAKVIELFYEEI